MWWLVVFAGAFFLRSYIAKFLAPILPNIDGLRLAHYLNLALLFSAVAYILPIQLLGLGDIKRWLYIASMWCAVLSCGATLKTNYGAYWPDLSGVSFSIRNYKETLSTVGMKMQPFLQQAMQSADFHSLFFSLIFLTSAPSIVVVFCVARRALWIVCTNCSKAETPNRLFSLFQPTWKKLLDKKDDVMLYESLAQVVYGLWLLVGLITPFRQIVTCVLFWHYLKMRFNVPTAMEQKANKPPQHRKAWAVVAEKTKPVFDSLPILNKGVDFVKNWFAQ